MKECTVHGIPNPTGDHPLRIPARAVALGFLIAAPLFAQQADAPDAVTNPFAANRSAIPSGRVLFAQTCSACHGDGAQGGRAPALASGEFTHGGEDADIFRNIRSGISGTAMPAFAALSTDDTWRIVTYIRSLNANAARSRENVTGDQAVGEAIFWGKGGCGQCHEVNGRGSSFGPDLSDTAKNSAAYLRSSLLTPTVQSSGYGPRRNRSTGVSVTLRDGSTLQGMRRAEDNFWLLLMDQAGATRRINRDDIAEEHDLANSLMPSNYGQLLTPAEVQNLIAYMKTLKARDLTQTIKADLPAGLTYNALIDALKTPQNWLTYWGDYQGSHFSRLTQIDKSNVKQLQAQWSLQTPAGPLLEANPVVIDGTMYTTYTENAGQGVYALDARSGLVLWKYDRRQKTINPYQTNPFNRGVAVLGDRVFFGTLDGALVALDARSGRPLWETQIADTMQGYTLTAAPLAVKGEIIVGVAGGEFGIRGFVDAYDAVTGKQLWRFYTIPAPGEPGNDTWSGDSWKQGAGATWLTGSYDPELNLVYWTVGNPGPDIDPDVRKGDNLYTCSVVALDADTGKLKWHYQFTPNDTHDWDANTDVILADAPVAGVQRKLLLQADRNGIYYVLDRTNGKFLFAKPYVKQTWNKGFNADGTPILVEKWKASPEGTEVAPSGTGGSDWNNPSYDASRSTLFVVAADGGPYGFRSGTDAYEPGRQYIGGRQFQVVGDPRQGFLLALDTRTGDIKWKYNTVVTSYAAGDLATAGGVVFLCTGDGSLIALDSDTGKTLWHVSTGGAIASAPISYAVDGKQFIALSAGNVLYAYALPD